VAAAAPSTQAAAGLPGGSLATPTPPEPTPTPYSPLATAVTQSVTATGVSDFLAAQGAVDEHNPYWAQSTVAVTLASPVSFLKIDVTIDQNGAVASTGAWSSIGNRAIIAVRTTGTAVTYEFTVPGVTLQGGRYYFGVQYNHAQGARPTGHDLYTVEAVASPSGTQQQTGGHF
jgi:hypothetical protein